MSKYRKSLNRRSSADRGVRPARKSSHPSAEIDAGYAHEFKTLDTPDYQPGNPYNEPRIAAGDESESSAPASPIGSLSFRKPMISRDSGLSASDGYFGRPLSTFSAAASTINLEPYGRSQAFGAPDSAWDLHAPDSANGSRTTSPFGSTLHLPQGAASPGWLREGLVSSHRNRSVTHHPNASRLGVCMEGEVEDHAHAQQPSMARQESSISLEEQEPARPLYDRATTS